MTASYDARMARAKFLETVHPFAAQILTYYRQVCAAQKQLQKELEKAAPPRANGGPSALREQIDVDLLMPRAGAVLGGLSDHSPGPLAEFLREFLVRSDAQRATALREYAERGGTDEAAGDAREQLAAAILIQPYAELLAARSGAPAAGAAGNLCPKCGARPVAGVLRVEGDGGKRFLLCAFCGTEWDFRRILCAYCGETREQSLPVFVAEKFAQIRVEACDTCRHCLRTVDLTKDGHAVPVADDLAAIPLALWADEHGYTRIHGNLLGT